MIFSFVLWYHRHQHWHHMMTLALHDASAFVPALCDVDTTTSGHCISLVKIIRVRCNMTFLAMWYHCHQYSYHVMSTVLSMVPLHLNWNEVQHNIFVMTLLALVLVSYDAHHVVNGTIAFLRSSQLRWAVKLFFGHVLPFVLALPSHGANSIINAIIAFLGSRWLTWPATWLFFGMWPINVVYMYTSHYCIYK